VTRNNITIAILAILIVVLCALCYVGKPLLENRYVPSMAKLLMSLDRTDIGDDILTHYLRRVESDVAYKIGPAMGLNPEEKEKVFLLILRRMFVALVALVGFITVMALFLINGGGRQTPVSKTRVVITVVMVILAGTIIRLVLAMGVFGNFDMDSYEIVVGIARKGGNVYAETKRYNYSPVWFMVLMALKRIQIAMPDLPFHFVVRLFLCCIDLLTLGVLLFIANIRKLPPARTAILFYLSPVSFLVTGYHGQFENFAILMVLTGILLYLWFAARPVLRVALLWLFATAGMIVKHNVFYELIVCLHSSIKRYWIKISLFVASVAIFLSLFIPYWAAGRTGIIDNVFKYGSFSGTYGVTSLFELPYLKYLFIAAMFLFPLVLRNRDIIAQCLLGVLFFLTFTTGFAAQYLVLPVALGAIRPSKFLLFYTLTASVLFLGNDNITAIPGFHLLKLNVVWVAVICWFVSEMRLDRQANGVVAERLDYREKDKKK